MNISFPQQSAYEARATSVAFPAVVDGHTRRCLVTNEALEDHFGAISMEPGHLQQIFEANRGEIQVVAQERFLSGAMGDVFLRTQDFQS
jgi:hypothetical protein